MQNNQNKNLVQEKSIEFFRLIKEKFNQLHLNIIDKINSLNSIDNFKN